LPPTAPAKRKRDSGDCAAADRDEPSRYAPAKRKRDSGDCAAADRDEPSRYAPAKPKTRSRRLPRHYFNRLPGRKAVANRRRLEPTVCRAHNAVSNRPAFGRRLRPVEAPAPSPSTLAAQRA